MMEVNKPPHINLKGCMTMNALGRLEKMLIAGSITEDEYCEKKRVYVETILELYCLDIITKEEMYEKLNK